MDRFSLKQHQLDAIKKMRNGCILCGGVGSGKTRTALAYYYIQYGGELFSEDYVYMKNPVDLYIITTAKKRDSLDWAIEMVPFLISPNKDPAETPYTNNVVIDSWNNIKKYNNVYNAFFIFDEQRVSGKGVWVKSFLKIARYNKWILLSATPGDTWMDYIPVFVANGFYRNRSEFIANHVIYKNYRNFYQVDEYKNTGKLAYLRNRILVDMDFYRHTIPHHDDIWVGYDKEAYKQICRKRWNPWEDRPIDNASEFCQALRRVVNSSDERQKALLEILEKHPKAIIFYNYNYELNILRELGERFYPSLEIAEWNGHKHQEVPTSDRWIYLVQYTAGAEGWNCITTDTIIFYSQNYSYKVMAQSSGRIDRMNTPFIDLYYYHLKSRSGIDLAISKALRDKKKFNETRFYGGK